MKNVIRKVLEMTTASLREQGVFLNAEAFSFEVNFPKDETHGDYTSNIAMALVASGEKSPPLQIAERIKEELLKHEEMDRFRIETVFPGYLNFSYTEEALVDIVHDINISGQTFSESEIGKGITVNLEYISANPTGPLHIGNARGGFFGDSLARVLRKTGYGVSTEYYVNDAGEQVVKLGHSILKDGESVYEGEYIENISKQLSNLNFQLTIEERIENKESGIKNEEPRITDNLQPTTDNGVRERLTADNSPLGTAREVGEWATEKVLEEYIKKTISEKMKISFDSFISEKKDIVEAGYIERAIEAYKEKNLIFEQDGALWLKTTLFGDDKDRVLVKTNGEKTYFASDCGYILHKKERNFKRLMEIWGADHHGYVARFRAAAEALGFERDEIKFILVQLVRLMKDGQEVRMSKRAGNVVLVDDLIDRVGADVAKFFFLLYSPDTHMNFDLELAEERSQKNPVYYVQYAHARMASIFRKAEEEPGITDNLQLTTDNGVRERLTIDNSQCGSGARVENEELGIKKGGIILKNKKEILLARHLAKFPEVIEGVAETFSVHTLPQYAIHLADIFHSFYNECAVLDSNNPETTHSRLALVRATKTILAETLRLMGVSAPERM